MSGIHDHTAPFRCGLTRCKRCAGKPTYAEWWGTKTRERARRRTEAADRARTRIRWAGMGLADEDEEP